MVNMVDEGHVYNPNYTSQQSNLNTKNKYYAKIFIKVTFLPHSTLSNFDCESIAALMRAREKYKIRQTDIYFEILVQGSL